MVRSARPTAGAAACDLLDGHDDAVYPHGGQQIRLDCLSEANDGPVRRPQRCHPTLNLLKFGLGPNYWNEFVFKSYLNFQPDAVFLTGIPDMKATLPHA